jgi:hypothetical protein
MLHYLERLLNPFCCSSKGSLPPFVKKSKDVNIACKLKKSVKTIMYCMQLSDPFLQLAKGSLISLRAVAIVFSCPLDSFACGIGKVHATQIMFCNIPLREVKSKFRNGDNILNSFSHPWFLYSSRPVQPYHIQTNLIWCDGIFK